MLILMMTGCKASSKGVTLGEVNGNQYSNDYFGFSFTFPEYWDEVYSRQSVEEITKLDNLVSLSKEIDLEKQDCLTLFQIVGNPFMRVMAFKIGTENRYFEGIQITTVEKLIDIQRGLYREKGINVSDAQNKTIGSKAFKRFEIMFEDNDRRDFYFCEANGYILRFEIQFHEMHDEVEDFIDSIKFY